MRADLLTCWPVITEAAWLIRKHPGAIQRLLKAVDAGVLQVLNLDNAAPGWLAEFIERYRKLGAQLVDAALVYLAEREGIETRQSRFADVHAGSARFLDLPFQRQSFADSYPFAVMWRVRDTFGGLSPRPGGAIVDSQGREPSFLYTNPPSKRLTGLTRLGNDPRCSLSATAMPFSSILARADSTCVEQRGREPLELVSPIGLSPEGAAHGFRTRERFCRP